MIDKADIARATEIKSQIEDMLIELDKFARYAHQENYFASVKANIEHALTDVAGMGNYSIHELISDMWEQYDSQEN